MKSSMIGKPVLVPSIDSEGIVCGYSILQDVYTVETDYGWVTDVKLEDMIPIVASQAPEDNQVQTVTT